MKLLLDNNLSYKLVAKLHNKFPNSTHVMFEKLDFSEDIEIWQFAKDNNFVIMTKDIDFNELSVLNGFPPKVIWLNIGNCKNDEIEKAIQSHSVELILFSTDSESGIIEIN